MVYYCSSIVFNNYLYDVTGENGTNYFACNIRPILTLKSTLDVSGSGTSSSPYQLN